MAPAPSTASGTTQAFFQNTGGFSTTPRTGHTQWGSCVQTFEDCSTFTATYTSGATTGGGLTTRVILATLVVLPRASRAACGAAVIAWKRDCARQFGATCVSQKIEAQTKVFELRSHSSRYLPQNLRERRWMASSHSRQILIAHAGPGRRQDQTSGRDQALSGLRSRSTVASFRLALSSAGKDELVPCMQTE